MAVLTESQLKASVKSGSFSNVYLFYGQDYYTIGQYTKALINKLVAESARDLNLHEFDGFDFDMGELADACEGLPMFAEYNCCVLSNLNVKNKNLFPKDDYDQLISVIKNIPETTVLIIYYSSIDICEGKKTPDAAYKRLIDNVGKIGTVCAFPIKTVSENAKDIASYVKKRKGIIGFDEAAYLAELCSGNRLLINSECDKLISYANGSPITKEMIELLCAGQADAKLNYLSAAVINRNRTSAMQVYNELCEMQTEPISMLYTITNAIIDAYRARTAFDAGKGPADVKEDFEYKNKGFVVDNAFKTINRADITHLRRCIDLLIECEMTIKARPAQLQSIIIEETLIKMLS